MAVSMCKHFQSKITLLATSLKLKTIRPIFSIGFVKIRPYSHNITKNKISPFDYCVQLVRKHDYENYLCTLLLPNNVRNSAFVIRAFNVELAQIRDLVSKPELGYMRLKFWKDTLQNIYAEKPPSQPVAIELWKVIRKHDLSKSWFLRLISSREESMSDKGFLTTEELESYSEKSVSSIYYLILQAMGIANVQCDHVASHVGKSQGITNLLRSIPFQASKGRLCFPLQTMSKHKITQDDLMRGKLQPNIKEAVFDIASIAHQHLNLARSMKKDVPKDVQAAFLPAVSVSSFLTTLQKRDFDIFHSSVAQRNNLLPFSLWLSRLRKTY